MDGGGERGIRGTHQGEKERTANRAVDGDDDDDDAAFSPCPAARWVSVRDLQKCQ